MGCSPGLVKHLHFPVDALLSKKDKKLLYVMRGVYVWICMGMCVCVDML